MLHVRACVCTRVLQCAKLIIPYWGVVQFLVRIEKITDIDKKRKCCFWGMRKCMSVYTCFACRGWSIAGLLKAASSKVTGTYQH